MTLLSLNFFTVALYKISHVSDIIRSLFFVRYLKEEVHGEDSLGIRLPKKDKGE